MRRNTRQVTAGSVAIGGGAPVSIQSMTNTDTRDVEATVAQILRLEQAGCEIVRSSVYDEDCARAIAKIKPRIHIPLVADIHFDYRLAIAAAENGVDKLRINPGNIGERSRVEKLADCAKAHHVPIRIGVNSGSVEKDMLAKYGGPTPEALAQSAMGHARILEQVRFYDIVISAKTSNVSDCIATYRLLSEMTDYPLHLGVTEAGWGDVGVVKGAIGIGALLSDGIGDTIRVSLTGDPVEEVKAARLILDALDMTKRGAHLICCPTCGRTRVKLDEIAKRVKDALADAPGYAKVAVMGCAVNGPGEAREADIGIAFGKDNAVVFKHGEKVYADKLPQVVDRFIVDAKQVMLEGEAKNG